LYFAPVFFPESDETIKQLQAAAAFALGFRMRPIGAWIMGIYADRKGHIAGLTLFVTLICVGSVMIACAPFYDTVGMLAPDFFCLHDHYISVSVENMILVRST
jgi:MHS family alpha-ketoglutarate permease-like MFS transporter